MLTNVIFFFSLFFQVAEKYRDTYCKMSVDVVKSYLPFSWISMAQTKEFFYKGLAHYYVAMALIGQKGCVSMCSNLWRILIAKF